MIELGQHNMAYTHTHTTSTLSKLAIYAYVRCVAAERLKA